ncbi:hypothetical protein TNCV_2671711 [Trichonephila clavipes]|nr:hypothetical protein TNCV_2671711 [Trichonephila clavipes]
MLDLDRFIESSHRCFSSESECFSSGQPHGRDPLTDHLIKTSAHAPQHPMVTYTAMGTVGSDPHGLLCH